MARFTGLRKLCSDMIRIGSFLKIREVAGIAGRRQSEKLADRCALVAIIALHRSVSAQQREAILVVLHLLNGDIPSLNRVALLAIASHLPPVDVLVAILTILAYLCEHGLDVALRAFNLFMHTAQGIFGLVVIKFRNRADGTPTRRGVAVFARDGKGSVRTPCGLPLWLSSKGVCGCRQEQEKTTQ
jgi:hypothetical protein